MAKIDPVYDKFIAFARAARDGNDYDESDAIQFREDGTLGDAEHNVGSIGRAICLTDEAAKSRAANNKIRGEFLTAIVHQFGTSLDDIPQSVKEVLKIKDYGLQRNGDGSYSFTSGRPLTVRRIAQVLTAVNNAKADAEEAKNQADKEYATLWEATQAVAPGERISARGKPMREVCIADPLLAANGRLNNLGKQVCNFAEKVFRDGMAKLDAVGKNMYLRDFQNRAREAAEFTSEVVRGVHEHFENTLPNAAPDDARAATRRRILIEQLTLVASKELLLGFENVAGKTPKELLAGLWKLDAALAHEQQFIETAFEMATRITDAIEKTYGVAGGEDEFEAQTRCLLEAGAGFVCAMDAHTVEDTHKIREKGFAQMYKSVYDFHRQDAEKALKTYTRILKMNIAKPKYTSGAVELANLFEGKQLVIPANATPDQFRRFLEEVQKATLDKGNEIAHRYDEFSSDDIRQLNAAFFVLLLATHPELAESLGQLPEATLDSAMVALETDANSAAMSMDRTAAVNFRAQSQMALALELLHP